jgi:UDP-glucose 4-epimerase
MKIGITGSRGFIGSYVSRRLLERPSGTVRLLVRNTLSDATIDGAEVVHGDLSSVTDCACFAADLDLIYYLAHTNSPINSDYDQATDAMMNQVPLLNLIQAVQRLGSRPHIVYFSSGGAVYAPKFDNVRYKETDACAPLSSYGIQKLAAEHYLRLAAHKGHLTATVLRVGNAYGTLLPQHRMQGLIGVAINCVLHNKPVRVFGNPHNVRDYVHLEDVCSIVERVAEPRGPFTVLNVGSGEGHSVLQVLTLIEACCGSPLSIETDVDCGRQLVDWVVLDNSLARREYGWSPAVNLRSGIDAMIEAHRLEVQTRVAFSSK